MPATIDGESESMFLEQLRDQIVRIPRSAAITPGLIVIGLGVGFSSLVVSPGNSSLRLFLSALATVQASLIAIVFAVTILAVQLTADRYTMRIAPIFYRHPVFQITLLAFLISIAADLGLLFFQQYAALPLYQAFLYGAVGLAIANGWLFRLYIRTSIKFNTPEGVISAIGEEITPAQFFVQVQSKSQTDPPHPLLPMYSVARRAIEDEEFETAQTAIAHYSRVISAIMEEGIDEELFTELPHDRRDWAVDEVFDRHLPDLAIRAAEIDESTLVSQTIALQGDLGKRGLRTDYHVITEPAFRGLAKLSHQKAPINMDHYQIHSEVWNEMGEMLVAAAEYPAPRTVDRLIISARSFAGQQLGFNFSFSIHPNLLTDYLRDLKTVQSALIEEHGEDLRTSHFDWFNGFEKGGEAASVIALMRCRDHFFQISGLILQLMEENDRYPVIEGDYREIWREMAIKAIKSGPADYGQTLCEAMIEIAYIQSVYSERDLYFWTYPLARVMAESDPGVVQTAFERILQFEKLDQESMAGDIPVQRVTERNKRYRNHLEARFPSLNAHVQFPDRIEEIREHVQNQYEELTEEAEEGA